jgi:2-methylisocitrate lyase-like PEP mutase family enzyme
MLAAAARIIRAVSVPVTVDFEAGYGLSPADAVHRLVEIGAAGFNYEDTDHTGAAGLVTAEVQSERIAELKAAGRAAGVDLVLNARVDVFIQRQGSPDEQAAEGLRRAALYREAGADCVYPILLSDEATIARFVQSVGTINVNVRPGGPLTLKRVTELGVRRVSYAVSLYRATMASLEALTKDVQTEAAALPDLP